MQNIEKVGTPKEVWVMCPGCRELFYIHRAFYEPKYSNVKLCCPFCHKEFSKEKALKTWGAD
jgi:sarcosine oxidase delta subunit